MVRVNSLAPGLRMLDRSSTMSDSESDSESPARTAEYIEIDRPIEIVEDLTGEDDLLSESRSSSAALNFSDSAPSVKPRSYQIEMLEESLKHNIIVAADTGSGKTHM
jgi:superfamily II DNA or RNA helicase